MTNLASLSEDRNSAIREVGKRGVDDPATLCSTLPTPTILATLKWYDKKQGREKNISAGLLAWKLNEGGVSANEQPKVWTDEVREAWLERHLPDEDPVPAETALIGIARTGAVPTPERVRSLIASEKSKGRM